MLSPGKAQCQVYQGVQSHRHTLWLWCGKAISLLPSHDSVTLDITWTLLLQKNSDHKRTYGEGERIGNAWTFCFKVPLLKSLRLYRHVRLVYSDTITHLHLSSSRPYTAKPSWIMVLKAKVYYISFCLCKVLKQRLGTTTSVPPRFSWLKHAAVLTCDAEDLSWKWASHPQQLPLLVKMTSRVFTSFYLSYWSNRFALISAHPRFLFFFLEN